MSDHASEHTLSATNLPLVNRIQALVDAGLVDGQTTLCRLLLEQGIDINQSTASRVLRKLGAVKVKDPSGQIRYTIPTHFAPPSVEAPLAQLVVEVINTGTLVVVHTRPGAATLIASIIDHHRSDLAAAGIVAGDDTFFVAPKSAENMTKVHRGVLRLLDRLSL